MPGLHIYRNKHPIYRRLAVLTEGTEDIYRNKTAMGLLRFRPEDVLCVIDTNLVAGAPREGRPQIDGRIPVVATIAEAVKLGVEWLVIGVSTPGGYLPDGIRQHVYDAIRARVGVISGLHESVSGDPNLVALAARHAVELINLRSTPDDRLVSTGKARGSKGWRLLVVGTDANIGKTTAALALERHLNRGDYGIKARFVSTSQDGILITGRGMAVDRMISDFAGGMVERLVLDEDRTGADILVIEGQNSILSPCYSGTAMSLVHGSCPDAMVLCHNTSRTLFRHTDAAMPDLTTFIDLYQRITAPLHPAAVVAIALNTQGLSDEQAAAAIAAVSAATDLPTADPVREGEAGLARLAAAVLAARGQRPSRAAVRKPAAAKLKISAKKPEKSAKKLAVKPAGAARKVRSAAR